MDRQTLVATNANGDVDDGAVEVVAVVVAVVAVVVVNVEHYHHHLDHVCVAVKSLSPVLVVQLLPLIQQHDGVTIAPSREIDKKKQGKNIRNKTNGK